MSPRPNPPGPEPPTQRRRTVISRLGHAAAGVTLGALVITAVPAVGTQVTSRELCTPSTGVPPAGWPEVHAPAGHGDVVVAVVLGDSGIVASDVLAPYEVFASSAAFSVYTVAEHADPVPLTGGTSLIPTYTFDDVEAGHARPDVVVVPAVEDPAGGRPFQASAATGCQLRPASSDR